MTIYFSIMYTKYANFMTPHWILYNDCDSKNVNTFKITVIRGVCVRIYVTSGSYMKVFSSSKFPGVRFPLRVYANSLPIRISFSPTFSLFFPSVSFYSLSLVRRLSLFSCAHYYYYSLATDNCRRYFPRSTSRAIIKIFSR